jgi:dATP pyrophosphohydrolase
MRAPFQILVLPYRKNNNKFEFAIFKRADAGYWQSIAGGSEDNETPLEAAKRELFEETGIKSDSLQKLQFFSHVPKTEFAAHKTWSEDIYVIPEYYFMVELSNENIELSDEHTEYRWADYDNAHNLLHWQSNKVGLWKLNERLKK